MVIFPLVVELFRHLGLLVLGAGEDVPAAARRRHQPEKLARSPAPTYQLTQICAVTNFHFFLVINFLFLNLSLCFFVKNFLHGAIKLHHHCITFFSMVMLVLEDLESLRAVMVRMARHQGGHGSATQEEEVDHGEVFTA